MTVLSDRRAEFRERRLQRARETPLVMSNGLTVYGAATPLERRFEHFISDYFQPGGVDVRPGMTVLDVGANIGMFSLELLRRCGGDARIFAFEPAPETFGYLQRNLRRSFPGAAAQAVCQAVADRPGTATFYHRPSQSGRSSLLAGWSPTDDSRFEASLREPPEEYRDRIPGWFQRLPHWAAKALLRQGHRLVVDDVVPVRCQVTTVSDVLHEHALERVDFLKVDVEGAELSVLEGVAAEDWGRITQLGVELHDIDGRLQKVREMLADAGFDDLAVEQNWPFEGTNVYLVQARRRARGRLRSYTGGAGDARCG